MLTSAGGLKGDIQTPRPLGATQHKCTKLQDALCKIVTLICVGDVANVPVQLRAPLKEVWGVFLGVDGQWRRVRV